MVGGTYIVFRVATIWCGLEQEFVRRVLPLPMLDQPPGLPEAIEGTFDLAGTVVPVLRLDRLFDLTPSPPSLYQHLVLYRRDQPPLALLVDVVTHVVTVPADRLKPLADGETLNGCVVGRFEIGETTVHVLDGHRLLDAHERRALADFQTSQQRRHERLEAGA